MKEELKNYLFEKLNLKDKSIKDQTEILRNKEEEVSSVLSYLKELRMHKEKEKNLEWLNEINMQMRSDFPDLTCALGNIECKWDWPDSHIITNFINWPPMRLTIEINQEDNGVYYGIRAIEEYEFDNKIDELVKDNYFKNFEPKNQIWYCYKYSSFENAYEDFKKFYKKMEELVTRNNSH